MQKKLPELYLERGRLLERIAYERHDVAFALKPLQDAEDLGRRVCVLGSSAATFIRDRPWWVALVVAGVVVAKPRRVWPWLLRGVALWRGWRSLRAVMPPALQAFVTATLRS